MRLASRGEIPRVTPHHDITRCRACGGAELTTVFALGEQALTGVFPREPDAAITRGPLDLVRCSAPGGCGLVQLRQSYDAREMYGEHYGYRSGLNASMVRHLQAKVQRILAMDVLRDGDAVVDIGANDGTTLGAYPPGRFRLLGVDPTGEKFRRFYPPQVDLLADFFAGAAVRARLGQRARVITAFSMFYDLEDPVAFAREVAALLEPDGVFVLEQSYLPSMLRTNSFDTICHEHLEFYGLRQLAWILGQAGLQVLDVELNDVNGGSISVVAGHADGPRLPARARVDAVLADERAMALDTERPYAEFRERVALAGKRLMHFLREAQARGQRVAGLGASTKGNVLLQYFGVDAALLPVIGEVNPDKFGAFTPGTRIPLAPEDEVLASHPDYLLVLPWHFKEFFLRAEKFRGRQLVFPLPEFDIVTP